MELFPLFSAVLAVAALFGWVNHRFLGLPTTIGVMAISLACSLALLGLDRLGLDVRAPAVTFLERLQFREAVLDVFLAFLLFAGALHVDLGRLLGQKRVVGILATAGIVLTTFAVGVLTWAVTDALGLDAGFLPCLVFGALISPTDPIAVLGILRRVGVPPSLETKIVGESLFNDGVGVVVFAVILGIAAGGGDAGPGAIALFFVREVLGSMVLGVAVGWFVYRLMRSVENYQLEVLLSLALACGLYSLAAALHASGPLAVVVAGLFIGNTGRSLAMSAETVQHLDTFWELVDEILNVLLFVLLGLEILVVSFEPAFLLAGLAAIPVVLLARFASVGGTVAFLRPLRAFTPGAVRVMTWGGLRGGISVALALSIPATLPERGLILTITYVVVVFSILVQGTTIGALARKVVPAS